MRCWFWLCKFHWFFNVPNMAGGFFGIYQCFRCKALSLGCARDPCHPERFLSEAHDDA